MPLGVKEEPPTELDQKIDFTHPDFALTVRMENSNNGVSRYFYSDDRGRSWRGAFRLPLFGQKGVIGRTDYLVNGPDDCTRFLTASKANGREGRPFVARTTDGGRTWNFLSFIGPEPLGSAIMPSTARVSSHALVTTIRRKDGARSWIDAHGSDEDGRTWSFRSNLEPDTGEGNPPSLVRLDDGRLCLVYGVRSRPSGILARTSADDGKTGGARSPSTTTDEAMTSATSAPSSAPMATSSPSMITPTVRDPHAPSPRPSGARGRRDDFPAGNSSTSCLPPDRVLESGLWTGFERSAGRSTSKTPAGPPFRRGHFIEAG